MSVQKCVACESEDMRKGEVEMPLPKIGNVKVPATICNHCGESYINEREIRVLENVMKAVKEQAVGA
ncbi:type II toxin-antitoxin system MqsA family antitoxin [Paenibacillus enshidis]|uniref:Type II toxin-antitoxin system MqsA family antitoxin n=2 Tax=Paenibacillus TaxID=44249 RepID=A0ABV5C978_9BACL